QVFIEGKDLSEVTMDTLPRGAVAERLEHEALMYALKQFLSFFATGTSQPNFSADDIRTEGAGWISYRRGEKRARRFSPLCARLVHMLQAQAAGAVAKNSLWQNRAADISLRGKSAHD